MPSAGDARRGDRSGRPLAAPCLHRFSPAIVVGAVGLVCLGCTVEPGPGAQAPTSTVLDGVAEDPTWGWNDAQVQAFWARIAPGPRLAPIAWPNGARVAVALSFDYQMGTVYDPNPASSVNTNSTYDGRVGLPRILALLDQYDVPASFFITGVTAHLYPETIRSIVESGRHEIGVHGWIHERTSDLPLEDERRLLRKAIESLERVSGRRPVGYRSPSWELSANTLGLLRELDFLYDSSMMADEEPYEVLVQGQRTGLVEVPVEWIRDDAVYFRRSDPHSQEEVLEVWKAEFDVAYDEGGLFQLTMHPRITGHRSRVAMLQQLILYMSARPDVWFGTHEAVARHVGARLPAVQDVN